MKLFTRPCSGAAPPAHARRATPPTLVSERVSLARRSATGDRARRLAGAVAVGARHRPQARRPLRPAAGPEQPPPERRRALDGAITWSYELLFPDDQVGLWALSCFAGGASLDAVEHVLAALGVPAVGSPRHDHPARGPLAGERSTPARTATVRYRLLDSIRSYAADRLRESGKHGRRCVARTPSGTPRPLAGATPTSAVRTSHSASAWSGPSGPTSTRRWPGAPSTTRYSGGASPSGSAGPGWCSVTAPPARRACVVRSRDTLPAAEHAAGCCWPAGSRRRPATWRWLRPTWTRPSSSSPGSMTSVLRGGRLTVTRPSSAIQQGRPDVVLASAATASRSIAHGS